MEYIIIDNVAIGTYEVNGEIAHFEVPINIELNIDDQILHRIEIFNNSLTKRNIQNGNQG